MLDRFKFLLQENADKIAELISAEHGKAHDDALGEVTRGLEVVELRSASRTCSRGEVTENVGTNVDSHSLRQRSGSSPASRRSTSPAWCRFGCSRLRSPAASFGGWKASLFGDHHMHGPEGVRFYTRLKTITTRWPTGMRAEAEFVMPTMG
jgi:acyl-CoA reductase-like NAD-dependent aldehyde dehydrogenase